MKIFDNFLSIFVLKRLERFDTFRYKISCIKLKGGQNGAFVEL